MFHIYVILGSRCLVQSRFSFTSSVRVTVLSEHVVNDDEQETSE